MRKFIDWLIRLLGGIPKSAYEREMENQHCTTAEKIAQIGRLEVENNNLKKKLDKALELNAEIAKKLSAATEKEEPIHVTYEYVAKETPIITLESSFVIPPDMKVQLNLSEEELREKILEDFIHENEYTLRNMIDVEVYKDILNMQTVAYCRLKLARNI